MCRFYGFRANELTKVECSLAGAQNALLLQSRHDLRGISHADGWGLSWYANGLPQTERSSAAAFEGPRFKMTASQIYGKTVIAHIRRATVGGTEIVNTHPFRFGPWIFAHNGTINGFETVKAQLQAETNTDLLSHRAGSTDSEAAFYWLLTQVANAGLDIESGKVDQSSCIRCFRESIQRLLKYCDRAGDEKPLLNFILTNGKFMLASRYGHSLYFVERKGIHDCEICGIPHIRHHESREYRAIVLASEPISEEDWLLLPEPSIVSISQDVRIKIEQL